MPLPPLLGQYAEFIAKLPAGDSSPELAAVSTELKLLGEFGDALLAGNEMTDLARRYSDVTVTHGALLAEMPMWHSAHPVTSAAAIDSALFAKRVSVVVGPFPAPAPPAGIGTEYRIVVGPFPKPPTPPVGICPLCGHSIP